MWAWRSTLLLMQEKEDATEHLMTIRQKPDLGLLSQQFIFKLCSAAAAVHSPV